MRVLTSFPFLASILEDLTLFFCLIPVSLLFFLVLSGGSVVVLVSLAGSDVRTQEPTGSLLRKNREEPLKSVRRESVCISECPGVLL